jgi:hypothetical protein
LTQYRRAISEKLGDYALFTTTSQATGDDAARQLIVSSLIDDEISSQTYSQCWVYITSGALTGEQRRLRKNALDGSTGTLTCTRAFGSTPASAITFEVHTQFPAINTTGVIGLREIINRALRRIWFQDFISVSAVTNQIRYTLDTTTYPWLKQPGVIKGLWSPVTSATDHKQIEAAPYDVFFDGESVVLQLSRTYVTGETFELEVRRPAWTKLRQSGTWTDQTSEFTGLSAESDEAIPDVETVTTVGLWYAYQDLAKTGPEENRQWYTDMAKQARRHSMGMEHLIKVVGDSKPHHMLTSWTTPVGSTFR